MAQLDLSWLPPDLCVVRRGRDSAGATRAVYHFEQPVGNVGFQKAMVGVLSAAFEATGAKLVCCEGSFKGEPYRTDYTAFGEPAVRRRVALAKLEAGDIHAEQFLAICGEHDYQLAGVDDECLYKNSLAAKKELLSRNRMWPRIFASLAEDMYAHFGITTCYDDQQRRRRRVDSPLSEVFFDVHERFESSERREKFLDRIDILKEHDGSSGVNLRGMRHVQQLLKTLEREKQIDFERVIAGSEEVSRELRRLLSHIDEIIRRSFRQMGVPPDQASAEYLQSELDSQSPQGAEILRSHIGRTAVGRMLRLAVHEESVPFPKDVPELLTMLQRKLCQIAAELDRRFAAQDDQELSRFAAMRLSGKFELYDFLSDVFALFEMESDIATDFVRYGQYLRRFFLTDHSRVLVEVEEATDSLLESLTKTDGDRIFLRLTKRIDELARLFDGKVTRTLALESMRHRRELHHDSFCAELEIAMPESNALATLKTMQIEYERTLKAASDFYFNQRDRSVALGTNTVDALQTTNQPVALLLATGYHSQEIGSTLETYPDIAFATILTHARGIESGIDGRYDQILMESSK